MTRLLIIRHGQSTANIQGVFAGHVDSALTELGLRQAELTAEYIVTNYTVDRVYGSDLRRAFATGKAVADRLGLEITPDAALREIYAGIWEGVPMAELAESYGEPYQIWMHDIGNAVCEGGESVAQMQERIVSAVCRIARENPGKTVVIATHAAAIKALQCHCEGRPLDEMKDVPWVDNASVTDIVWENDRLRVIEAGHSAHLGELVSKLPKNV